MKKLLIAAVIVLAAGTSAFATDESKGINHKTQNSFAEQFAGASNVAWSEAGNYLKASFTLADENVEAFYSKDGELAGLSRKVDLKNLPLSAIQKIKKEYASYTVGQSIEFDKDGDKSYYVSLADGNKKMILQVSLYGNVSVFLGSK